MSVTAERVDTLALVRADAIQLHAALDQAGIGAHGRSMEFHLSDPQTAGASVVAAAAHTSARTVQETASSDLGADRGFGSGGAQTGAGAGNDGRPAPGGFRAPWPEASGHEHDASDTARILQPPPATRPMLRAVDFTA